MRTGRDKGEEKKRARAEGIPKQVGGLVHTVFFFVQHCGDVTVTTHFSLLPSQSCGDAGIFLLAASCMSANLHARHCSKHREQSSE